MTAKTADEAADAAFWAAFDDTDADPFRVAITAAVDAVRETRDAEIAAWLRDRASRYGLGDNGRFALIRAAEKLETGKL